MFWLGRTKSLYHSSFGSWFLELEPTKDLDPPSQYMNQFWLGPAKRVDILWLVYYLLDLDPPSQFWLGPTKPLCYCLFGLLFLGFGPTKIHGSPEGQHNLVALWIAVCKMFLMTFRVMPFRHCFKGRHQLTPQIMCQSPRMGWDGGPRAGGLGCLKICFSRSCFFFIELIMFSMVEASQNLTLGWPSHFFVVMNRLITCCFGEIPWLTNTADEHFGKF